MVRKSQTCSKLAKGTNLAFLALIPKEKGERNFSRFRPISLCILVTNWLPKSYPARLRKFCQPLFWKTKAASFKGHEILENIVLLQEAIHSSCQQKEKGMVIKLDLANAFDRVRHYFIFIVMDKLGFAKEFIRWVKACISSPWIAPLVNGFSADFFQSSRGLR